MFATTNSMFGKVNCAHSATVLSTHFHLITRGIFETFTQLVTDKNIETS